VTAGTGAGPAGKDFFISHAGRDRAWAEWVAWHLLEAGYTVELDAWDWAAGENFVARMHGAVDAAGRVVAVLSEAYFEEGRYTADEWSAALVKDDHGGHRLVPVQVEPCPLPRLLRPLVRVELFGVDEAEAARRLLEAVRGPRRPDGVPVFPGSGTAGVLTGRGEAGPRLPGALPPVWNVGPRNPAFVGREAALASVHERLRSGGAAVVQALHGLGGVGKSQLAIEYAHRFAGSYDVVWWVNADQAGLVGEQYAALAAELGLVGPRTDTATAVNALRAWLRGHGRWLLVLDSAESPREVRDWLPAGPGHTLITSRHPGWGELAGRVEVDVLSRAESVALIHTYRPGVGEADAHRLAEALGDLPLALAQAAGFLAETGTPVGDYLDLLAARAGELLDEGPPEAHPLSLAAAIRLSTDRLAQVDPAALAMVRVGAFLAPDPIPADLLTGQIPPPGESPPPDLAALAAAVASPVAARRSLGRAGGYGLARTEGGLQLHRLTQAVLRDQLPTGQAGAYRAYAQALLVAADPGDERDPTSWPGWARILPHLLATGPATGPSPDLRDLACRAASYLFNRGDTHPARDLADHLHRGWREHLGPDDPHALRVASTLVRVLVDIGPYGQARRLGEDTLTRSQRVLGDDHPDTLQAAHQLACCLHEVGAFEQARALNEDNLARRRRVFGDDHAACQRTAHNLARDLRALGEVEAARRLQEDNLAYRRRVLGDGHPGTINTAIELGISLRLAGEADAARRLHDDTVALARRVLGEDHLYTVEAVKELARDLHALGDFEAARRLSEDSLTRARRVLGEGSHFTIDVANDLAADLHALGEDEAARQLSDDTFRLARKVLGDNHPHTRRAAENLAAARSALGEVEDSP
jgi:hypothetical protein